MSLLRRLTGHRNKNHHQHLKDDAVEMSTSASDGNSPEKQQDEQNHSAALLHRLSSSNKSSSKQKLNGAVGNKGASLTSASAPSTPKQQPAPPPAGMSANKRSASRSLFKKRRPRGVSTSPTTPTKDKETIDEKNGGKGDDDNNNNIMNGGDVIHLNTAAHDAAGGAAGHVGGEDSTTTALTRKPPCYTPTKTPSRRSVNHLPPTPEAVPLHMELQFPTNSTAGASSTTTTSAPPPPKSSTKAPTTSSKSAAAQPAIAPPTYTATTATASGAPPPPAPRTALADVAASYAEKSARLAAHKAHWWSLFSHHPHQRQKNKKRSNNNNRAAASTAAATASLPTIKSSPRHGALRRTSNIVYSPTADAAASAASSGGPQHVLIVTDNSDLLNNPEYRNKIAKEAAALDKEGNDFFQQGNYDDAFLCYEKAMTLKRQSLYATNQQLIKEQGGEDGGDDDDNASVTSQVTTDSKASILASVATSINNMTYLKQRAGLATAEETMAAYLKSLQIKRDILGPNHLSVGKTLNNIGSVFYIKREFEPALKAYQSAHEIMATQLGSEHLDVGTVISNIGDVMSAMETGDGSYKRQAMEHYRRALDIRWNALGPNDPKVIRLMEQLAWLETGKQPQKLEEELSDSEDEEFANEDRKRHEAFQEDVRVLQDELAEDMIFFDLLERKMAIDMVKDKTRCFRELRELQQELELNSNTSINISSHHGSGAAASVQWGEETTDHTDGSDAVLTTESAPPNMAPAAAAESGDSEAMSVVTDIGNFVDPNSSTRNSADQQPSPSQSSFLEKADAATAAAAGSSPSGLSSLHEIRPSPPGMRKGQLTEKERKEALTSVRARLAALRASRDPNESDITENDDDDGIGKGSVSVNAEDKKKYDGNGENSDSPRKQQTQAVQQCPDSPSSRNPLEDGLEELTMEINRTNAGKFRTSTSPGVLASSIPLTPENADKNTSDCDERQTGKEGECNELQNDNIQNQEPGNGKEER